MPFGFESTDDDEEEDQRVPTEREGGSPPKRARTDQPSGADLGIDPAGTNRDGPSGGDRARFYRILSEGTTHSGRYRGARYQGRFTFIELERAPDPEAVLRQVIQQSVDAAIRAAREQAIEPDRLIVLVSCPSFESDVVVHVQSLNEDAVASILHRLEVVDQSNKAKDRGTLFGNIFTVDVTALSRAELRQAVAEDRGRPRTRHMGSQRLPREFVAPIRRSRQDLIRIVNADRYCLFRAIIFGRKRHELNRQAFFRYRYNEARIYRDIRHMMRQLRIPRHIPYYDVETYGQGVEDWINRGNTKPYRLFAFSDAGHYQPIFEGNTPRWDREICLYYNYHHYDLIPNIRSYFCCRNYCFHCHRPYREDLDHNIKCRARCINCTRVKHGNCRPDPHFPPVSCLGCGKHFVNRSCWEFHEEKGICQKIKQCLACGVVSNVKVNRKNGRDGHKCEEKFCHRCRGFHSRKRMCYIKPLAKPEGERDYRIILYDFETTQETQPDEGHMRFLHAVNFVGARVICTECIRDGKWDRPLARPCTICGPRRTFAWSQMGFQRTAVDQQFVGPNPLQSFVEWLLHAFNTGPQRNFRNLVLAHNGGRFDAIFIFGEIFRLGGLCPSIIKQGNKLYKMVVKKKGVITETHFHDTINIMPVSLGNTIKCFNLHVREKPFFPYIYNRRANLDHVLPHLPPREDYLDGGMMPAKRRLFDVWYVEHQGDEFDLREELAAYCMNDVEILTHAVVKMREQYKQITGLDILKCVTIASACMKHFRTNHLTDRHLALVPENGYEKKFNQSTIARKFLKWYAHKYNVAVQDCDSAEGEYHYRQRYYLDGFVRRPPPQGNVAIEVYGCYFHACRDHFPGDDLVLAEGKTAKMVRARNRIREHAIREEMQLKIYWECGIRAMLERDKAMRTFFNDCPDTGAINLRDAFFGGRTGPEWTFAQEQRNEWTGEPEETIKYMDIMSLYPYIMANTAYPVSHPIPLVHNMEVNWSGEMHPHHYKGLVKCFIHPPVVSKHYDSESCAAPFPVVPMRLPGDPRLLFPYCRKCAEENRIGRNDPDYTCMHPNAKDRGWVATLCHEELVMALKCGYTVSYLYRTYHFNKWDDQLFKGYVREFLRIKIQSSGWPSDCCSKLFTEEQLKAAVLDDDPEFTAEQRAELARVCEARKKYLEDNKRRHGIEIAYGDIQLNHGLRYISKLCLNSLWYDQEGRFALRNKLSLTEIVDCPAKLLDHLEDKTIEVTALHEMNEECMLVTYRKIDEFIMENPSSNIVSTMQNKCHNTSLLLIVALWTTAMARLQLYKFIAQVRKRPGADVLYMDTDSLVFKYPPNPEDVEGWYEHERNRGRFDDEDPAQARAQPCPILPDCFLGEMQDEYPDYRIVEFLSAGCKQWALKLISLERPDEPPKFEHKLRGITLDHDACQRLSYDQFKDRVIAFGQTPTRVIEDRRAAGGGDIFAPVTLQYRQIKPNLVRGCVETREIVKNYKPVISKGMLIRHHVVPFGYFNPKHRYSDQFIEEFRQNNPLTCVEEGVFDPNHFTR